MSEIDEETRALYLRAIESWGAESQLRQLQEECGELIVKINHLLRDRCGTEQVAEELADVEIMGEQAHVLCGYEFSRLVADARAVKLARLKARLDEVDNV